MRDDHLLHAETAPDRLRLSVWAAFAALAPARRAVLAFLAPLALAPSIVFDIELILEEILINSIRHAFAERSENHRIELDVQIRADTVVLRFENDGIEFDPTRVPEPRLPTNLAEATPGGFGLMLVRRRAQSFEYLRREGRNIIVISVRRGSTGWPPQRRT